MEQYFSEKSNKEGWIQGIKIKKQIFSKVSKFQKIGVFETCEFGKLLALDDKGMFTEADEFIYHEIMGHISVMAHPNAKNVLIIGGGDAGIISELVKYPHIENIDLVEIDEEVINTSKEFFPKVSKGLSDPRVNILATDGIEYVKNKKNTYDIILVDSTDPEGFALGLFSQSFYQDAFDCLKEDGIMMNQTENPFFKEYDIPQIYQNLQAAFPVVKAVSAPMISYPGVFWTFAVCSKKYNPNSINSIHKNKMYELERNLEWYNMDWHQGAFSLSNYVKKGLGLQ